jgi:two-component system chemotaxis response regulator CheB
MTVKESEDGEQAQPGIVYMAPGGLHLKLVREGTQVVMRLTKDPPENSCRPAVDVLFRSAAEIYGNGLLAVIMTGMGQDGMKGCQLVKQLHGQIVAQDEATSVIWGMPQAVIKHGLADRILPLEDIADEIVFRSRSVSQRL